MTDRWETRQTLLQRAKDPEDHQAWDEFAKYYKQFIHVVLYRMSFRPSDYQDVEQEILVTIWKNIHRFETDENRGRFRSWLSSLIRNKVIDYIRKSKQYESRREMASEQYEERDIMQQSEFDILVQKEWKRYLTQTALENIRELFSGVAVQAFEMSLEGKTSKEISDILDINQNSVRTLKNRVKVRLVKEIERLRGELEF